MNKARAKDLARKRREYVREKLSAAGLTVLCAILAFSTGAWALNFLLIFLYLLFGRGNAAPYLALWAWWVLPRIFAIGASYFSYKSFNKWLALPYIPPVVEQIAALPAEQILVRSSYQPAATPTELLRAAPEGTRTVERELLRPEPASTEEKLEQI